MREINFAYLIASYLKSISPPRECETVSALKKYFPEEFAYSEVFPESLFLVYGWVQRGRQRTQGPC